MSKIILTLLVIFKLSIWCACLRPNKPSFRGGGRQEVLSYRLEVPYILAYKTENFGQNFILVLPFDLYAGGSIKAVPKLKTTRCVF